MKRADVIIAGGGIAGVSCAARLAGRARVVLLEREAMLAMHTTGRSAAVFTETYGNAIVRELTQASRPFFDRPPAGFTERPLLNKRGSIMIARLEDGGELEKLVAENPKHMFPMSADEALRAVPVLRRDYFATAALEPEAADIDVHALFDGFRRMALKGGVEIVNNAEVTALERDGAGWRIATAAGAFAAPVFVNAAGSWAGQIGELAGLGDRGLRPLRRTAIMIDAPPGADMTRWMIANDAAERFYFKPDAGQILASLCDETPSPPCDAQPEEIDVATLAYRLEEATTLNISRIRRRWAGLRTFTPQRTPIFAFDAAAPGFFWLAGQGGYGIQTSPEISRRAADAIVAVL